MTTLPKARARGYRGSWYADVNGERLPCVHQKNKDGAVYDAACLDDKRHRKLLHDIQAAGRVVLRLSERESENHPWEAKGYDGVWAVEDVKLENGRFTLRFSQRLIELQGKTK
jgi:hypothetical protein